MVGQQVMKQNILNRLSPDEALEKWGREMQTTLPDGTIVYASFGDIDGTWHPVFDEDIEAH